MYLLALEEVDGTDFIVDFLEVECDPDAPRARGAEVGVEDRLVGGSVCCHYRKLSLVGLLNEE